MRLFGYLGPFSDDDHTDRYLHYGMQVAGAEPCARSTPGHDPVLACWGQVSASDDGITAVTQGRQRTAAAPSSDPAPAASNGLLAQIRTYRRAGHRSIESWRDSGCIAIVDGPARIALLAVDPMGTEALAYATCGQGLVFSTSAGAVAHFPAMTARLRQQALYDYLLHHMVPAPETVYEGVRKLEPGTYVLFQQGTATVKRHWQAAFDAARRPSFEALQAELRQSLQTAVRSCAPDASTGAFLSGGLDSSTVAGVLSEVAARPTRTFSIGFGYPEYDELPYARIANAHFGCEGHEYVVQGDDIAATFALIARAYDEPFGNSSALPLYYCARLAREHGVSHLLAGDGGDELFAGNSRYAEQRIFEAYRRIPGLLRRRLLEPALKHWPDALTFPLVRKAQGYVEKSTVPLPRRLEIWNLIYRWGATEVLHPEFLSAVDPEAPLRRMDDVWRSTPSEEYLHRMLYYDWHYTLADNDLRKVVTMSALAGVDVSFPMLHRDVVDLSTCVPPAMLMPGTELRTFYKRAMTGFLPDAILDKKKHGFGLPFGLWLQESSELRDLIFGNLSGFRSRGIVQPSFIDRLMQLHDHNDARYYGVFIWVLAMLEQWLQEHRISP